MSEFLCINVLGLSSHSGDLSCQMLVDRKETQEYSLQEQFSVTVPSQSAVGFKIPQSGYEVSIPADSLPQDTIITLPLFQTTTDLQEIPREVTSPFLRMIVYPLETTIPTEEYSDEAKHSVEDSFDRNSLHFGKELLRNEHSRRNEIEKELKQLVLDYENFMHQAHTRQTSDLQAINRKDIEIEELSRRIIQIEREKEEILLQNSQLQEIVDKSQIQDSLILLLQEEVKDLKEMLKVSERSRSKLRSEMDKPQETAEVYSLIEIIKLKDQQLEAAYNEISNNTVTEDCVRKYLKTHGLNEQLRFLHDNVYEFGEREITLFKIAQEITVQDGDKFVMLADFLTNTFNYELALDESSIFLSCENILENRKNRNKF